MGLSLKDSPAGFDPAAAALAYSDTDWNDDTDDGGYGVVPVPEVADDTDYAETEQI
jgi:DNA-directed RNA polymerase subunit alpha